MTADSQIRLGIYSHLVAAMICAAFTLADRGLLISADISHTFNGVLSALLLPALCAAVICPLAVLAGVIQLRKRRDTVIFAMISEALVTWIWFEALAPSVSEYAP
jgi:hypothetical protein